MRWNTFVGVALLQLGAWVSSPGQTGIHRLVGITAMPEQTISLELAGSVAVAYSSYFDLYVLEASNNVTDWTPLPTLLRTNNSANRLFYLDSHAPEHPSRVYRTLSNQLPTAFPKPTGPHPVGTTSILLTDPSRTNRYGTMWRATVPS